jgi:hypothetical protein
MKCEVNRLFHARLLARVPNVYFLHGLPNSPQIGLKSGYVRDRCCWRSYFNPQGRAFSTRFSKLFIFEEAIYVVKFTALQSSPTASIPNIPQIVSVVARLGPARHLLAPRRNDRPEAPYPQTRVGPRSCNLSPSSAPSGRSRAMRRARSRLPQMPRPSC